MDDFVYFSEDPAVKALFERLLQEWVKVEFMGLVEWFPVQAQDMPAGKQTLGYFPTVIS